MKEESLYKDDFIELTPDHITFSHYFTPFKKFRTLNLTDIEGIEVLEPTLLNGKYRLSGTGNFKDWFPADYGRSRRDKIFRTHIKKRYWRVCFTVEDSATLERILKKEGLIKQ